MKIKVNKGEAIAIAYIKNYERHRKFYKQELEISTNKDETLDLIGKYDDDLVSTIDKLIVSPYLKSSAEREEYHHSKSADVFKFSGILTLGSISSLGGFFMTNSNGFLTSGICLFVLAVANVINGTYNFVKSIKEKNKRIDIIDTWEYDKEKSPIDVLDFCEVNNIQLITDPFYFKLTHIRDNREDKTDLMDPFRKNRFKKECKRLVKEGVDEEDYRFYKEVMEHIVNCDDNQKQSEENSNQ